MLCKLMMFAYVPCQLWLFGIGIGSFYNKLTLAILYRVVDTCDDHEPCSWEHNDNGRMQGVRFW